MRTSKKLLSFFLAVVMVVTTCSVGFTAFAGSNDDSIWQTSGIDSESAFDTLNTLADELPGLLMGIDTVADLVYEKGAAALGTTADNLTSAQKETIKNNVTLSDEDLSDGSTSVGMLGALQPMLLELLGSQFNGTQESFVVNVLGKQESKVSNYDYLNFDTDGDGKSDDTFFVVAGLCYTFYDDSSVTKATRNTLKTWLFGDVDNADKDGVFTGSAKKGSKTVSVEYTEDSLWYLTTLYEGYSASETAKDNAVAAVLNSFTSELEFVTSYQNAPLSVLKQFDFVTSAETLEAEAKADDDATNDVDYEAAITEKMVELAKTLSAYDVEGLEITGTQYDENGKVAGVTYSNEAIADFAFYYTDGNSAHELGSIYRVVLPIAKLAFDGLSSDSKAEGLSVLKEVSEDSEDEDSNTFLDETLNLSGIIVSSTENNLETSIISAISNETAKAKYEDQGFGTISDDATLAAYKEYLAAYIALQDCYAQWQGGYTLNENGTYYAEIVKGLIVDYATDDDGNKVTTVTDDDGNKVPLTPEKIDEAVISDYMPDGYSKYKNGGDFYLTDDELKDLFNLGSAVLKTSATNLSASSFQEFFTKGKFTADSGKLGVYSSSVTFKLPSALKNTAFAKIAGAITSDSFAEKNLSVYRGIISSFAYYNYDIYFSQGLSSSEAAVNDDGLYVLADGEHPLSDDGVIKYVTSATDENGNSYTADDYVSGTLKTTSFFTGEEITCKEAINEWIVNSYNYALAYVAQEYLDITSSDLTEDQGTLGYLSYIVPVKTYLDEQIESASNYTVESESTATVTLTDEQKAIVTENNFYASYYKSDDDIAMGTELLNQVLNGLIDMVFSDDGFAISGLLLNIAQIVDTLLTTSKNVDFASVLSDIWLNLVKEPVQTVFNLLPVLVVAVDEVLIPWLLTEDKGDIKSGDVVIRDVVVGLLRGSTSSDQESWAPETYTYYGGSYIGITNLQWDLNELLPNLMHWLMNDGSYTGDYWEAGTKTLIYGSKAEDKADDARELSKSQIYSNPNLVKKYTEVKNVDNGNVITYDEETGEFTYDGKTSTSEQTSDEAKLKYVLSDVKRAERFTVSYTYEGDVPNITGIYVVDLALRDADINDLENLLGKKITSEDGKVAKGLAETITEFADLFTQALDVFVNDSSYRNQVKDYDSSGNRVNRGLNNIGVALPELLDIIEDLAADKYGIDKDSWTFCYDGKITKKAKSGTASRVYYENATIYDLKKLASSNSNTKYNDVFEILADLFANDWVDALLSFANNITYSDSEISDNLPIITGLLQAVGGFSETSALTDILNSIFQITRESDYSFTFEEQDKTGYTGLDTDNAYFLITNAETLYKVIKALVDSFSSDDSDSDSSDSGSTGTDSSNEDETVATANLSSASIDDYTSDDLSDINDTIDSLDETLHQVLTDSSINDYNLSTTSNLAAGIVSLLSNYIGTDAANDTVTLLNTYLYYMNGERTADENGDAKKDEIYTNENLTNVLVRTFALIESAVANLTEDYAYSYTKNDKECSYNLLSEAVNGIVSPDTMAVRIADDNKAASKDLQKLASWNDAISGDEITVDIDWGIDDGDSDAFFEEFTKSIRLVSSVLGVLLIDTGIYENALYPILNAIGEKTGVTVDTPEEYAKETNGYNDEAVLGLLNPIVDWLDTFLEKPASTLINTISGLAVILDDSDTDSGTLASIITGVVSPINDEVEGLAQLLELEGGTLGATSPTFADLIRDKVGDVLEDYVDSNKDQTLDDCKIKNVSLSGTNIITIVNQLLSSTGIKLDNIDWNKLANSDDAGKALAYIAEYLVDTIKSNDNLKTIVELVAGDSTLSDSAVSAIEAIQDSKIDAKTLLTIIGKVLKITDNTTLMAWTFEHYLEEAIEGFSYPQGMTKAQADEAAEDIDKVINNIFPLLETFGVDLNGSNLTEILNSNLYTNKMVTTVVKAIYGGIHKNSTVRAVLSALGVVSSPSDIAALLTDSSYGATYTDAAEVIGSLDPNNTSCWDILPDDISWGFTDGAANAQQGFVNALTAALRPFYPLLSVFLNEGTLGFEMSELNESFSNDSISGTVTLKDNKLTLVFKSPKYADSEDSTIIIDFSSIGGINGTNGYNSATIPLLEALQCTDVKSYADYQSDVSTAKDNLLLDILNPIIGSGNSVINQIAESPMVTLATLLPNIAVFLDGNGLSQLVANLLAPVTDLIATLDDELNMDTLLSYIIDTVANDGTVSADTINDIIGGSSSGIKSLGDTVGSLLGMDSGELTIDLSDLASCNLQDAVIPLVNTILANLSTTDESKKDLYAALNKIQLVDADWNLLASLGDRVTYTSKATDTDGNALTGKKLENVDYGKSLITVLRFLVDNIKANIDPINSLAGSLVSSIEKESTRNTINAIISNVVTQIKTHTTDNIITALYYFFVGSNTDTLWDYSVYKTKTNSFTYPDGVTQENVDALVSFIDGIVDELDLSTLVSDNLYTDSIINSLAELIYTNIEKTTISGSITLGDILDIVGISTSSSDVVSLLTDNKYGETAQFKSAAEAITKAGSWSKVDFDSLSWGVKDQATFLNALVAILRPFYGVLDVILADGQLNILEGISIPGSNAYESAIAPLLEALDCKNIKSYDHYLSDKSKAYDNLLLDILNPLLGLVDDAVENPLTTIAEALPNLALFIGNDGVTKFLVNLITPVTALIKAVNPVIDVDALLYDLTGVELNGKKISITNLDEFVGQYTDGGNLVSTLNKYLTTVGVTIPEIDWLALAALGDVKSINSAVEAIGNRIYVNANTGQVVVAVLRYVLNLALTNGDAIKGLLGSSYTGTVKDILDLIFSMSADEILALIFNLVDVTQSPTEVYWCYENYKSKLTNFTYPDGITAEDAENAVSQLDQAVSGVMSLLNGLDVVKSDNLQGVISSALFTNSTVTKLATGLYGALDTDKIAPYLKMAGISVSPKGVAKLLTDKSYGKTYSSAAKALKKATSWKKVTSVNWGFTDGSKNAEQGFINAVTAVLRPFIDILGPFLNGESLELGTILYNVINQLDISSGSKAKGETLVTLKKGILDIQTQSDGKYSSVITLDFTNLNTLKKLNFYGSNGYENAIIPLFDVLQIDNSEIKSYSQYVKDCNKEKDNVLLDVLNPLMSFVDTLCDAPFDTLTSVIPNLAYFLENGGIGQLLDNLLSPVTEYLKSAKKNGVDIDKIIKQLAGKNLGTLLMDLLKVKGVNLKLKLTDLQSCNIADVLVPLINSLLKKTGIKLPTISWATLASHGDVVTSTSKAKNDTGKYTNKEVIADKGETLVAVLRYLADTLIKNASALKSLLGSIKAIKDSDMLSSIITSVFNTIGIAAKDDIVRAVFYFLTGEPTNAFWDYSAYETGDYDFTYPDGIDTDFLKQLPPMLDGLISGLIDGGLASLVTKSLYTDDLINKLLTGLYGAIETVNITDDTDLVELLAMTDIDFSTENVAKLLKDSDYGQTYNSNASVIAAADSWANLDTTKLDWGVKDRNTFFHALVAVLRPIYGVLDVLLNDAYLGLFDIVRIPGSNGYTSSIVPILEAFSCYNIKTQYQYREDMNKEYDYILLDIINPLWDKIEDLLNAPLQTLAAMVPNLALFIGNDGLCQIFDNLLTPVSALIDAIKPVVNLNDIIEKLLPALNVDLDSLLAKVGITNFTLDLYDINATLKQLLGADQIIPLINNILPLIEISGTSLNIQLNDVDWLQLASHGKTIVSASQAATYGARVYVEGDSSETLIAVLRYLIQTINAGDNFDNISSLIGGLLGGNESISGTVNEVLGMLEGDTDEVIASLVDLLQTLA